MLAEKLSIDMKSLAKQLRGGLVVTRGAEGVEIIDGHGTLQIDGLDVNKLLGAAPADPTGCGDAFRGGLLFGLARGASLLDSARLGNIMGAIKVTHRGGQNHTVRPTEVAQVLQTIYPDTATRLGKHLQPLS